METCFNYTDKDKAYFSSDERKFITKVRRMQEKYPDKVRIIKQPEDNDGCIYAQVPVEWFKIGPKRTVSDEQKEKSRVRMEQMIADGRVRKSTNGK